MVRGRLWQGDGHYLVVFLPVQGACCRHSVAVRRFMFRLALDFYGKKERMSLLTLTLKNVSKGSLLCFFGFLTSPLATLDLDLHFLKCLWHFHLQIQQ